MSKRRNQHVTMVTTKPLTWSMATLRSCTGRPSPGPHTCSSRERTWSLSRPRSVSSSNDSCVGKRGGRGGAYAGQAGGRRRARVRIAGINQENLSFWHQSRKLQPTQYTCRFGTPHVERTRSAQQDKYSPRLPSHIYFVHQPDTTVSTDDAE